MKKIALILSVLMLFALVFGACAKTGTAAPTAAPTKAPEATAAPATAAPAEPAGPDLEKSKPNEYVQEKLDAGKEVLISCSMIADVPVLMEVWAGQIKNVIEPLGFKWALSHAGGDTGQMISQIENYSLMGAAAILLVPPDANSVKDAILKAQDAGSYCFVYGLKACDYAYSIRNDATLSAVMAIEMGIAWGKATFPDASEAKPIKFCIMYNADVEDPKIAGEEMIRVTNADPLCEAVFINDASHGGVDSGFTTAENALTFDKDIRVFVCSQGTDALGASNYIMSQPGLDYTKYATFGTGSDTAGLKAIKELTPAGQSVFRGSTEFTEQNGEALANCAVKALFGEIPTYPYEYMISCYPYVQPGFVEFDMSVRTVYGK